MTSVTIPGTGSSTITETFGNTANLQLATQIRDALVSASLQTPSLLNVSTTATPGLVAGPPLATHTGQINELVITAGGDYTIPAGSAGAPDYVVVLDSLAPVTIHGAPNATILGGLANVTIIDPAAIVLSEQNGNATATISGTSDVLVGNNQKDTLTASGVAGSISGGTGTNVFIDLGSNDTISAQGKNDTIFGGPGKATIQIASLAGGEMVVGGEGTLFVTDLAVAINAAGGDTIFGGDGLLNVTTSGTFARIVETGGGGIKAVDTGTSDTIVGGSGSANVTLAGHTASIVGGFGGLFVTDNGIGDTIMAGSGFTTIGAATASSFVQGGAGLLTFVGGTGVSTIVGGSSGATVFGGTGATSLVGNDGSAFTYVNTTSGGLSFTAGAGSETLDASLSKTGGTQFGGLDTAGHNLLIGGAGVEALVAGSGSDTLIGGGGGDFFDFFKANGGPAANDVIGDFSAIDTVILVNYTYGEATTAIAGATTANGSTTLTLSDNTRITFTGVTNAAALTGHIIQT